MKRFFGLKLKRSLFKKVFVSFLVISIILAPNFANWLGLKQNLFVKEVSADTGNILPNGDGTITGWSSTGTNYYTQINEGTTPNTSTYMNIRFTDTSPAFIRMSSISDVDSVSQIQLFVYHNDGARGELFAQLFNDNETTTYSSETAFTQRSTNTWDSITFSGLSLTQEQLDSLSVRFRADRAQGGAPNDVFVYTAYAVVTYTAFSPTVTVGTAGSQANSVEADTSDFHIGGAFTLQRDTASTSVTSITISQTGTISDTNISGLTLYYKEEASCSTSIPPDADVFNSSTGSFSSGSSTVTGNMTVGTDQVCVYVEIDVGSNASNGDTIEIEITNPSLEIIVSEGVVEPNTPIAISGTTTVAVNQPPTFTDFEDNGPVNPGTNITFTATASDPDGDDVILVVCETQGISGTSCTGTTLCTSSPTPSNPSCQYELPAVIASGDYNAYPYVFDENDESADSELQGELATYSVNNVAPTISNVTINGGNDIDLEAGTTKEVVVTGTVTDNNGCEDIDSVEAFVYRSGVGGGGGGEVEVLTETFYFDASQGMDASEFIWANPENAFDGDEETWATSVHTGYELIGTGTNTTSPGSEYYITGVRYRLNSSSSWGIYSTLTEPSEGWSWQILEDLEITFFTTVDGVYTHMNSVVKYEEEELGTRSIFDVNTIAKAEIEVSYVETTTETYYFDASISGPNDPDNVWSNDGNAFDGSTSTSASTTTSGSTSSNYLEGKGTNAPLNSSYVTQVRARIFGGQDMTQNANIFANISYDSTSLGTAEWNEGGVEDYGDYTVLEIPSGGWSWEIIQELNTRIYSTNPTTEPNIIPSRPRIIEIEVSYIESTGNGGGGGDGCTTSEDSDNNNCYPNITCTVDTGTCTGAGDASANYTCIVDMQYYADPTDSNTPYSSENWLSLIRATDDAENTTETEVTQGVNVNSLMAFNITTEINFGSLSIGESNDPLDRITTITPTGNIGLNHEVYGPPNMCTDFPFCTGGTIAIEYQRYALEEETDYDAAISLTTEEAELLTKVPKPIEHPPVSRNIWWGMLVPEETGPGTYDGSITIIGYKSDILDW